MQAKYAKYGQIWPNVSCGLSEFFRKSNLPFHVCFGFWNQIDRDTKIFYEKKMFEIVWVYHLSDSAAGCEPPEGEDKLSEAFGRILINWTIYFLPLDNGGLYQIM